MAKFTLVLTLLAIVLISLELAEVEGRRGRWRGRFRNRGLGRSRGHQHGRGHRFKDLFREPTSDRSDPLSFLFDFHNRKMSMWNSFRSWWEGPNVCTEEEVVNRSENSHFFHRRSCTFTEQYQKCTYTKTPTEEVTVIRECCLGYEREGGDDGCPREVKVVNLISKAEELGLTDFLRVIKDLKLTGELERGNFTLFVPQNGAFTLDSDFFENGEGIILKDAPRVIAVSEPAVEQALEDIENAILSHVVPGVVKSFHMEDNELLTTASPDDTEIRINTGRDVQLTANCVPIISSDHSATNGVIHTVETVLKPIKESLTEIIARRPDLSILGKLQESSGLDFPEDVTLLAPTNAAFEKIDPKIRERIFKTRNQCLRKALINHLIPRVVCTTSSASQLAGGFFFQTEDNKTTVNSAEILEPNMMATDGVMHVIDKVFVPDSAFSLPTILEREGFTEFLGLLEKAGLMETVETDNVTVFAPTNEAIRSLPTAVRTKLKENPELLSNVLKYHLTPGLGPCEYQRQQQLPSLAGPSITFQRAHPFGRLMHDSLQPTTAQCIPLVSSKEFQSCNGRIKPITNVMMLPEGNVLDVLASDKKFSKFVSLLKRSGVADMLQEEGHFTVLAPNNEAFDMADPAELRRYNEDPMRLENLMKRHIIRSFICCSSVKKGQTIMNVLRERLRVDGVNDGRPSVEGASVVKCDQTATNGNVMETDKIIFQPGSEWFMRRNPFHDLDLNDLWSFLFRYQ